MSAVDARKEHYEAVEILGIPGLFTTLRVDRTTIPKGVYAYDMGISICPPVILKASSAASV